MKENLNYILEQIAKVLIVFVAILLIIGTIKVGKQFLSKVQSKVEPIPDYEMHDPQYNKEQIEIYNEN